MLLDQNIDIALRKRLRAVSLWMFFLLFALLILWALLPYKPFVAGIFAGGLVSFHHVIHIAHRLKKVEEKALVRSIPRGTGMISRILSLMIPLYLGVRYPGWIHPVSVFLGLPIGYVVFIAVEISLLKTEIKGGKTHWS